MTSRGEERDSNMSGGKNWFRSSNVSSSASWLATHELGDMLRYDSGPSLVHHYPSLVHPGFKVVNC